MLVVLQSVFIGSALTTNESSNFWRYDYLMASQGIGVWDNPKEKG
jgi:hypothetical protein